MTASAPSPTPAAQAATVPSAPAAPTRLLPARLALLAFITGFSGAIMPGPLLVTTIEKTSVQGMIAPLGLMTGHALLEILIVIALARGLHPLLGRARVRAAIGLVGGATLLWMGAEMLHQAWLGRSLGLAAGHEPADSFPMLLFFGVWITLSNPMFTGWWATIGAGQIAYMAPRTPAEYLAFYVGHEAADFAWYGFVGVLVLTGRRWLMGGAYLALLVVCGLLIVLIALRFLWIGTRLMREGNAEANAS